MTAQLTILTCILTAQLTSWGQAKTESKNEVRQTNTFKMDISLIAILPFDPTQYSFFKNGKPTELTKDELLKIETVLKRCIDNYNSDQNKLFNDIDRQHPEYINSKKNSSIDLTLYKRQYVAAINYIGQKEIWVNCFCDTWGRDWKKYLISVKDGGNCYFNLKINLTTGQYYELRVNGDA